MKTFLISFTRRKNFKLYLLILTILFSFIIIILSINQGLKLSIEEKNNTEVNRTVIVMTKEDESTFKEKTKHLPIEKITTFEIPITGILNENIIPIQECDVENQQIILPEQYILLVGTNVLIIHQNETYEYYVKGIHKEDFACVSNDDNRQLISQIEKTYMLIIDQQKNVEQSVSELQKMDYDVNIDLTKQNQASIFHNIQTALSITIIILVICLFGLFHLIFSDILQDEKYTIAILKSVGYTNKKLLLVTTIKLSFLIICVILLSIVLSSVFIFIMDYLINLKYKIPLSLTFFTLLTSFLILLSTFAIATIINMEKTKKVLPIEMFKSE